MVMKKASLLSPSFVPPHLFTLHDYASGVAVWEAASAAGVPFSKNGQPMVGFLSAPGAAGFMGVRWWLALIGEMEKHLQHPCFHILDCGESPGYAMAAAGLQQRIVLRGDSAGTRAVKRFYEEAGGHVFITRPPSFDLIPSLSVTTHLAAYFTRSYCQGRVPDLNSPEAKPEEGFPNDAYPPG